MIAISDADHAQLNAVLARAPQHALHVSLRDSYQMELNVSPNAVMESKSRASLAMTATTKTLTVAPALA